MSQRNSDYARRADDDYASPPWVAGAIAPYLREMGVINIWEPAAGAGSLVSAFGAEGFNILGTNGDFLKEEPPLIMDAVVTNPPFNQAREFIERAITMPVDVIAMLLRIDYDSAKTRAHLFRDCDCFVGKIVLLDRIVWFEPKVAGPSENHAWYVWGKRYSRDPWIRYAGKADAPR